MPVSREQRLAAKSVVALLLTFAAGVVDIVGYMMIYHFFTANMTGNTVHLGNKIALNDLGDLSKAASILASFVVGSILGRIIIEAGARKRMRKVASVTLFLEGMLLVAVIALTVQVRSAADLQAAPGLVCGLLAMLAGAMGFQAATLTRVGALTIHTTFVTGMLNKFAQSVSNWMFWAHDERRQGASLGSVLRRSGRQDSVRQARFVLGIWFFYLAGAIAGTYLNLHWYTRAFYLPVALVVISIAVDQFRPLSLEEEHEQV